MSKQLALSASFSVFMMAVYVLFGGQATRQPLELETPAAATSPIEVSLSLPEARAFLPSLR